MRLGAFGRGLGQGLLVLSGVVVAGCGSSNDAATSQASTAGGSGGATQAGAGGAASGGAAGTSGGAGGDSSAPGGIGGGAGAGAGGASDNGGAAGSGAGGAAGSTGGLAGSAGAAAGSAGSDTAGTGGADLGGMGGIGGVSGGGTGGTGGTGGASFVIAPHSDPTPIADEGGAVLKDAKVVTIVWSEDKSSKKYLDIVDFITTSDWAKALDLDYQTGTITHLQSVVIDTPAPATITLPQVMDFVDSGVGDGTLPKSSDAQGYLYFALYPAKTKILSASGTACTSIAIHSETPQHNIVAAYPESCAALSLGDAQVSHRSMIISRGLLETLVDPFPTTAPGWLFPVVANDTFSFGGASEAADWCFDEASFEGTYSLQRFWSNSSLAKHENGCLPYDAGQVAFGTSPPDTTIQHGKPGDTVDVVLTGWSEAALPQWKLLPQWFNGEFNPTPTVSQTTIGNGGQVTLSFHIPQTAKSGQTSQVVLYSNLSPTDYHTWPFHIIVD